MLYFSPQIWTSDNTDAIARLKIIMSQAETAPEDRTLATDARLKRDATGQPAASLELPDGTVVTGKTSNLLGACSALLLNALKRLAGIDQDVDIISPEIIEPTQKLKTEILGNHNPRLHINEMLIALSIAAVTDENAKAAMAALPLLRGCEAHSTVILSEVDSGTFRKLGVNLTCDPVYQTKKLYHN